MMPKQVSATKLKNEEKQYEKLNGKLIDIVIILLKKFDCLLSTEIWDHISGMFPFYENNYDPVEGNIIVQLVIEENGSLVYAQPIPGCEGVFIVSLLPTCKNESNVMSRLRKSLLAQPKASYHSDILHQLEVSSQKYGFPMYRKHKRPSLSSYKSGLEGKLKKINKKRPPEEIETSDGKKKCPENEKELPNVNHVPLDVSHNKSVDSSENHLKNSITPQSSIETHGSGKLGTTYTGDEKNDCDNKNGNKLENSSEELAQAENKEKSEAKDEWKGIMDQSLIRKNNLVCQLNFSFHDIQHQNSNPALESIESAWDSRHMMTNLAEFPTGSPEEWIRYFKRYKWLSTSGKELICYPCTYIENKFLKTGLSLHVPLDGTKKSQLSFLFSHHDEKRTHHMASLLTFKEIISSLRYILLYHFNDFQSINEILDALNRRSPHINISQDILSQYITLLGEYLEFEVVECTKKSQSILAITDCCRGYIILRHLTENYILEEHIISSYMGVKDKSPLKYATELLGRDEISYSISNGICKHCSRCKSSGIERNKLPLPLWAPQNEVFVMLLWRTKFLQHIFEFGVAVCQLCNLPPDKLEGLSSINWQRLKKFPIVPTVLYSVYHCKDLIQKVAQSSGVWLKSFSFSTFNWDLLDNFQELFVILENINIALLQLTNHQDNIFEELYSYRDQLYDFIESTESSHSKVTMLEEISRLVSTTIKEHEQSVYHKGHHLSNAYSIATSYENLCEFKNNVKIRNSCRLLFDSLHLGPEEPVSSIRKFLKHHRHCDNKIAVDTLTEFTKDSLKKTEYKGAFKFYSATALISFEPFSSSRSLYEMQIFENQFYRTAWCKFGDSIKAQLLTIVSELASGTKLCENKMCDWFFMNK